MLEKQVINELLSIELLAANVEAFAKNLRNKATGLRVLLEGDSSSTAPKGGLSDEDKDRVINKRMKNITRKQLQKQA